MNRFYFMLRFTQIWASSEIIIIIICQIVSWTLSISEKYIQVEIHVRHGEPECYT